LIETPPANLLDLNPAERIIKDAKDESGRDNLTTVTVAVRRE